MVDHPILQAVICGIIKKLCQMGHNNDLDHAAKSDTVIKHNKRSHRRIDITTQKPEDALLQTDIEITVARDDATTFQKAGEKRKSQIISCLSLHLEHEFDFTRRSKR